jgi:hypothetical protein
VACGRLHLSSTLLVLVAVVLVPPPDGAPVDVGAALLPVAWAYPTVQVACALHVTLVRVARRRPGVGARPRSRTS